MSIDTDIKKPKKSKGGKKRKVISFEEEVITKNKAQELLSQSKLNNSGSNVHSFHENGKKDENSLLTTSQENIADDSFNKKAKKKSKRKNKIENASDETGDIITEPPEEKQKKKKSKKKRNSLLSSDSGIDVLLVKKTKLDAGELNDKNEEETIPADEQSQEGNKKESIRQRKRKKHLKLMEEKKLKAELAMQQKCLTYLSQWKHSKNTWKFEKLKQIWLHNNTFDSAKIPDEFWETLLDYFNGSKGHVKKILIKKAIELIQVLGKNEENSKTTDDIEPENKESIIKLKRARDVVQFLQET